jgi:hypothetical protein
MKKVGVCCAVLAMMWTALVYAATAPGGAPAQPATAAQPAAQPSAPPQAEPVKLPADVLALVEVGNLVSFESKVRDLARRIDPTAVAPSFTQQMAPGVFKTADASTVDMTRPFQGVVLVPPYHHEPVLVFTVTDAARYLDSLKGLVKQKDEDGVHVYTEATPQAGPPGQEVPQGTPQGGKLVAIGTEGSRAVMGGDVEAVKKVIALIKAGSLSSEPVFKGSDVGGTVRLKALLDALDAEGQNPLTALRQSVAMMPQMGAAPGTDANAMIAASFEGIEAVAKQLDTATGRLSLDTTAIAGSFALQPIADSGVAKYLSQASSGEMELLKYLPAGAMIVFDGKVGDLAPLSEWYGKVMESLLPAGSQASAKTFQDLMHEWSAQLGNEMAISVSRTGQGSLLMVSAVKVKDASAAERLVQSMPARMQALMEAQKAAGVTTTVKINPNAISYNGLQISEWEVQYDFQAPPGPMGAQQTAMAKAMITAVWGGPALKGYSTIKDNTLIHTQGAGALEALKGILDGKTIPVAGSAPLLAALQGMPAKPVVEGYVSLQDTAGFLMEMFQRAMLQAMMPAGQQMPAMPRPQFRPAPPIGLVAQLAEGGALEGQVRIPVQAIISVANGIRPPARQGQRP